MDEKRINAELDIAKSQIRKDLMYELEVSFKREKEVFDEKIKLYLTVAKWLGASLIVLLSLLGLKTLTDIKTYVSDEFSKKLSTEFSVYKKNSRLEEEITAFVDNAIVSSTFLEALASKHDPSLLSAPHDRSHEIARIVEVIKDPSTITTRFNESIFGLQYLSSRGEENTGLTDLLAELLSGERDFAWINSQDTKRVSIINSFPESVTITENTAKIINKRVSDKVLVAILNRLGNARHASSMKDISEVARTTRTEQIKFLAYSTMIKIDPDSNITKDSLLKDSISDTGLEVAARNATLAIKLANAEPDNGLTQTVIQRIDQVSVPLLTAALTENTGLATVNHEKLKFSNSKYAPEFSSYELYNSEIIDSLLSTASNVSIDNLGKIMHALTPSNSDPSDQRLYVNFTIDLHPDGLILLEDGRKLLKNSLHEKNSEVKLSENIDFKNRSIFDPRHYIVTAKWLDKNGLPQVGQIKSLREVSFSASTQWGRDPCDQLSSDNIEECLKRKIIPRHETP